MGDMASGHEESVWADDSGLVGLGCPVDGDMLTDHGARPDFNAGNDLRIKSEILRIPSDDRKMIYFYSVAQHRTAFNDGMCGDGAALAKSDTGLDDGKRADGDLLREHGRGVDLGGGVNHLAGGLVPNNSSWAAFTIS